MFGAQPRYSGVQRWPAHQPHGARIVAAVNAATPRNPNADRFVLRFESPASQSNFARHVFKRKAPLVPGPFHEVDDSCYLPWLFGTNTVVLLVVALPAASAAWTVIV